MNSERWREENNAYLTASLRWLCLRLEQFAQRQYPPPAPPVAPTAITPGGRRSWRLWRAGQMQAVAVPQLALPSMTITEEMLVDAAAERQAAAEITPPPALVILGEKLSLSPFEQNVLLLCAGMELHTSIPTLCARAQGDPAHAYPTFALALALFDEPSWDALAPDGPLRRWLLLRINQPGAVPLTLSSLGADERIVNCLKGLNRLDDRLSSLLTPMPALVGGDLLSNSQRVQVEAIERGWRRASVAEPGALPMTVLLGADPTSKHLVAQAAATAAGRRLYRLGPEGLPPNTADVELLARLWQRESLLLPIALYVDAHDTDEQAMQAQAPLDRLLARDMGMLFLSLRDTPARSEQSALMLEVARPEPGEQRAAWAEALHETMTPEPEAAAAALASQFSLNLPEVRRISRALAGDGAPPTLDALWDACRDLTRPRLDRLADRIDTKATWDHLVLRDDQVLLLRQIADQVRHRSRVYEEWGFGQRMNRGLGISALFAGESGTGKTMAAEVIATELRLNLYRIDLSAVVSKYIGETEKNLRRLFDAAEDGGAILLFDEADALFGKRSEVKDSHDRYANIEINYLLQRMESYGGLAILATNMKSALDAAFIRRLRFIVNFPFPGPAERRLIWEKVFPADTPLDPIDYDRLARLNVTGGNIQGVALNAAFLAARAGTPVTMDLLRSATQSELRKLEKPETWV